LAATARAIPGRNPRPPLNTSPRALRPRRRDPGGNASTSTANNSANRSVVIAFRSRHELAMNALAQREKPLRRLSGPPAVAVCTAALYLVAADRLLAQSTSPPPACLYDGRSFSDGARICIQRNLMMTCTLEDARPRWTLVLDKELSSYCVTPTLREAQFDAGAPRPRVRHLRPRVAGPATIGPPACFTFSGKRYCE
jgi:hypothetical protein